MRASLRVILASLVASGCATTRFYDEEGEPLKGFPVVYRDGSGATRVLYVDTSTGFGSANFSVTVDPASRMYTVFTNNLDSTGAAQLTSGLLDKIADLQERAALQKVQLEQTRAILRDQTEALPLRAEEKAELLRRLDAR